MTLIVSIDGAEASFEYSRDAETCRFRLGEDAGRTASLVEVEPGIYSVLLDGRSYEVKVVDGPNGAVFVDLKGRHLAVEIQDPRRAVPKRRGFRGEGRESVAAPMPGRVVRVLVAEGDQVRAGQGMMVVEAMKMQNEMKASRDGTIISLTAAEGATVAAGDVLAILE